MGLDLVPWSDSDITIEDIRISGGIIKQCGFSVGRVRVAGGEPTLHKNLTECCDAITKYWGLKRAVVCTNAIIDYPKGISFRNVESSPEHFRKDVHKPPMVSPVDIGLDPVLGFNRLCKFSHRCGALFDAFGFSFCPKAGAIGRLLGIDPYQAEPVLLGNENICKHCPYSLPEELRMQVSSDVRNGIIEYPTETYRNAIRKCKENPMKFKKFQDRLQ